MKYGRFTDLSNVDTMDKVVTEDDLYIENGTRLRKDIHDFIVASVEKGQKIRILENQNRKHNLKNQRKDEEEKRWSTYKKALDTPARCQTLPQQLTRAAEVTKFVKCR